MHGFNPDNPSPSSPLFPEMIRTEKVSKSFGDLTAVSETTFTVKKGDIMGLVGSDGAGKTTLLRMVSTLLSPSRGSILINGLDIVKNRKKVKELIGYMPQRFGLYQDLSVSENIDFFMEIYGITGKERIRRKERYLGFSNLLPFIDRRAGDLSGGMKQKLGLACVLSHEPLVLILDEPTNGVDPVSRMEFWEILKEMKREGMTILVSTAYLDEGEKCDSLMLMHNAKILGQGTPDMIRGDFPDLEEAMIHHIQESDRTLMEDRFAI
jgi:ABC-2 type transport system ATP-binding protein